jgi:phosphoribosyl 1,2-cyclic phosphodiesterase
MKITFWGTRGSLPSAGPETHYYGGNTSCVSVRTNKHLLVLDAGSGVRRLGLSEWIKSYERIDILLTHLHMDHIQGLGFFRPLFDARTEIHLWGPASSGMTLAERLNRYLSPPLFPVRIRELPCQLAFHEVPSKHFTIGPFELSARYVCHPGPTVGYRIEQAGKVLAYIPDHEPALTAGNFPLAPEWTSGYALARQADLLIHDAQYTEEEYQTRVGWGHSAFQDAYRFAHLAGVKHLVLFHHDPSRTDRQLDRVFKEVFSDNGNPLSVSVARENDTIFLNGDS